MTESPLDSLLQTLQQLQLLNPQQWEEMEGSLRHEHTRKRALLEELHRRGWITTYQAQVLEQGKGTQLRIGPYLLLDRIGGGGMGQVFKARQCWMNKVMALKLILPERLSQTDAVDRFKREVQAAAQLSHPNIVPIYHADEADGTFYLAMELIEGTDMRQWVEENGPMPVSEAIEVIRQAAQGLQHAHRKQLVHRDIKPSNLLRTVDGRRVMLTDLGLARLSTSSTLTQGSKMLMGTADYIAPEQVADPRSVDIRADIYSLGCTFYHLLTGRPPFEHVHPLARAYFHQIEEPPPVEQFRPEVPQALAAIIRRMMAKAPGDRFPVPAAVVEALITASRRDRPPRVGDRLAGWQLEMLVYDNGRAQFFRGRKQDGSSATVEVLPAALARDAHFLQGFRQDMQALANLQHPHLGSIQEFGVDEEWSCPFLVTELLEGRWLHDELTRKGAFTPERAREFFLALADGLGKAHEQGVVHGNLHPGNIHIRPEGSPLILDFGGVTASVGSAHRLGLQSVGSAKLFAAPEQIRKSQADARSDVYALAGLLYHVLAYHDPKRREPEMFDREAVPGAFRDLLAEALHRDPARRPSNGSAFRVALLGSSAPAEQVTRPDAPPPPAENQRPQPIEFSLVGRLHYRAAERADTPWARLTRTPARVPLTPSEVYRWQLDRQITDAELVRALGDTRLPPCVICLELRGTQVTDAGLDSLGQLPHLQELDLGITAITAEGLHHLGALTSLRRLNLERTEISSEGLVHLSRLPGLEGLDLTRCSRLGNAALVHLGSLKELRDLRLREVALTDEALIHLAPLAKLERLSLAWCQQVTDRGLEHLRGLTNLRELDLGHTQVTDAGLHQLTRLRNLEVLDLDGTRVSDPGIASLCSLHSLHELNLGATHVTATGLMQLRTIAGLKRLQLWNCRGLHESDVNSLRGSFGRCEISY